MLNVVGGLPGTGEGRRPPRGSGSQGGCGRLRGLGVREILLGGLECFHGRCAGIEGCRKRGKLAVGAFDGAGPGSVLAGLGAEDSAVARAEDGQALPGLQPGLQAASFEKISDSPAPKVAASDEALRGNALAPPLIADVAAEAALATREGSNSHEVENEDTTVDRTAVGDPGEVAELGVHGDTVPAARPSRETDGSRTTEVKESDEPGTSMRGARERG